MVIFRRKGVRTGLYNKLNFKENKFYDLLLHPLAIQYIFWLGYLGFIHSQNRSQWWRKVKDSRGLKGMITLGMYRYLMGTWCQLPMWKKCTGFWAELNKKENQRRSVAWYKKMDFETVVIRLPVRPWSHPFNRR